MDPGSEKYKFNSSDEISVVNFYVNWCFYCKIQKLILNKFHQTIGNKARVYNIDSDRNRTLAEKLSVLSFPSILIFKNGNVVSRLTGLQDNETLIEAVNKYV
jgi:thioredoxin 1